MALAWLLTLLAFGGILAGAFAGQWRKGSSQMAAVGGALLFAIALFIVIPEVARNLGWALAAGLALLVCGGLMLVDRLLRHTLILPLLAATALHSFLDGWSVRALSAQSFASVAVPLGLALHKIPEGLALGFLTRKAMASASKAVAASAGVEALTLAGAIIEPRVSASGAARFGAWWTAIVLAVVAGSFLFLGVHSFVPHRRKD